MAVLRTDIVGSTPFRREVGDDIASNLFHHHLQSLELVVDTHGGKITSRLGDGVFAVFESVSASVRAAQEIQAMNAGQARWQDESPFELRIGLGAGELTFVDGEFTGWPMVEADRLQACLLYTSPSPRDS